MTMSRSRRTCINKSGKHSDIIIIVTLGWISGKEMTCELDHSSNSGDNCI